jgi:phytanoyl-CoA hydroxylase
MTFIDLQRLKADFERDGFVILRGFVAPEEVKEIGDRAAEALNSLRQKADKHTQAKQTEAAHAKKPKAKHRFTNVAKGLDRVDDYFADYLNHGAHVPIIEAITGETPTPATAAYFTKDTLDEEVHPHPDGTNGATIWLALDPTDEENGCLHFLKGSQSDFEAQAKKFRSYSTADLADHPDAVAAVLEPGDVSIHDARAIHWSGKNTSGKPRRGVNCFYQRMDKSLWKDKGAAK